MILKPNPITANAFCHQKGTCRLVGEISSTHGFGRVYDDACDEGFTVVHDNGTEVVYAVHRTERDRDGIAWWDLVPVNAQNAPTIRLFND